MDRGLYNLVVFLDLKKAFDTVNHRVLLSKLEMYGFNSKAINRLSYLSHRTQICQLTNVYSGERSYLWHSSRKHSGSSLISNL